ncbi:MAG: PAP2 family protein, partial [Staphylococcus epidermidis]|nr:PAP2 family protein [Staphylococcus epidermidis]
MVISKKLSLITIGILISILLISPLIDQQISNHFMNQDSIFGTLFQNYGLFPPTLILIISTVILNYYIFTTFQNKLAKILTLLISFIFTLIKTNEFV